jgi:DNA-directed RNA polymerase specialized sigma24 family protein
VVFRTYPKLPGAMNAVGDGSVLPVVVVAMSSAETIRIPAIAAVVVRIRWRDIVFWPVGLPGLWRSCEPLALSLHRKRSRQPLSKWAVFSNSPEIRVRMPLTPGWSAGAHSEGAVMSAPQSVIQRARAGHDDAFPRIWERCCEQIVGEERIPEFAAEMTEQFGGMMDALGVDSSRSIAQWKVEGYANVEVAEMNGYSLSTVERSLELIRTKWQREEA